MVAPYVNTSRFVTSQQCETGPAPASKLVNPNLVFKKRLQFHKEISDVQISFAHKPHNQENLVIEVNAAARKRRVCSLSVLVLSRTVAQTFNHKCGTNGVSGRNNRALS
jgi:hypothetical protein